jgi:chromate transport protein ChrA
MVADGLIIGIVGVLIVILAALAVVSLISKKKREKHEVNFDALFVLGIVFFVIGMSIGNTGLWVVGIALFVIGITGRGRKIVRRKLKRKN